MPKEKSLLKENHYQIDLVFYSNFTATNKAL
jgi:hypothetical protein